ncbi:MAG: ABC transporter ATP-binding protein [Oscillospiraceae bacterium]|jgi:ATP-binding cassette, subfamily B, bacterial
MGKQSTFREDYRKAFRLLNLVRTMDASILPQSILQAMLEAWSPYVSLFFTARLIDRLMAGNFQAAAWSALWLLGSSLILGLLTDYFSSRRNLLGNQIFHGLTRLLREKAMDLNYATISDPDVAKSVTSTEQFSRFHGGLFGLVTQFQSLLKSMLSALTALVLIVSLCLAPTRNGGLLTVLCSPMPNLISLGLVVGGTCYLSSRVNRRYQSQEHQNSVEHVDAENGLSYLLMHVFCNIDAGKVIRLYDMGDMLKENYRRYMDIARPVYVKMCKSERAFHLLNTALAGVSSIYAYLLVLLKVMAGAVSIGSFTQYVGALAAFQNDISRILYSSMRVRRMVNYLGHFLDFLALKSTHTGTIPTEKRQDHVYEIEFHHVSFAYPGSTEPVLKDLSCKLTLKHKMAVVGLNGAGKTTFIKLLCRLYDPTEGYITLNGVDIRKYDYRQYQALFGVVFQDFQLFPFPVGQNVAASLHFDEERLWRCLEQAGVADRVRAMGQKLETPISAVDEAGENVSGGEAQKLAIARALYKDAPFVVLDEPTAALDPLSEYEIYSRFDELVRDKTSIYISHRMSSCRFCQDILVFQEGRLVERGSHETLLEAKGLYASLWNAQAQYYVK